MGRAQNVLENMMETLYQRVLKQAKMDREKEAKLKAGDHINSLAPTFEKLKAQEAETARVIQRREVGASTHCKTP